MKKISFISSIFIWIAATSLHAQVQPAAYINFANGSANGITLVETNVANYQVYTESAVIGGTACRKIPGNRYMCLIVDKAKVPSTAKNVMVKITYYGNNTNSFRFQYNSTTNDEMGSDFTKIKSNDWMTTTVVLTDANFREALYPNDYKGDMRMGYNGENYIKEVSILLGTVDPEAEPIPVKPGNPASEFKGKSLAGYQVWHRAGNNASDWVHWSYGKVPGPGLNKNINVCSWPDISEYSDEILFKTNFSALGNGKPAKLYSSDNPVVINKHLDWMKAAGLDGVAIQRFVGGIGRTITEGGRNHLDEIRDAAERTNRLFYICYDLNYFPKDIIECFKKDWVYEIEKARALTSSPNYATVNGKPVVEIWGIGYSNLSHSDNIPDLTAEEMGKIIQFFHNRGCYVIAGAPRDWRNSMGSMNYQSVYNALDCISPWTVGVYGNVNDANSYYSVQVKYDLEYCKQNNIDFLPVCFAGSGNWVNSNTSLSVTSRLGGDFLWTQVRNAKKMEFNAVYFAMFDEFEESTQLVNAAVDYFDIPTDEYFETLAKDGVWVSSDYYLRLAGAAGKMLRGEIENTTEIPIPYSLGPIYFRNSFESRTTDFNRDQYTIKNKTMPIDPCFYKNAVDIKSNVSSVSCAIVKDEIRSKTGLYAAKLKGIADTETSVYSYKTNETKITVKEKMKLSYYKYTENEQGRNTGVDLIFKDGTRLSDFSPTYVKTSGSVGTLNKVEIIIGIPGITGKVITGIALRFAGGAGNFEAYFDDILIEDSDGTVIGIDNVKDKSAANVYSYNGNIIVESPEKNAVVSIYNVSGQIVYQQKITSDIFYQPINKGVYIVEVKGNGNLSREVVIVND